MDHGITSKLIDSVAGITEPALPPPAREVAKHCVLDWLGCAIAGSREPLSGILIDELGTGDPHGATLIARPERASIVDAALLNGAMSHALDFDDTHTLMCGHPSAPVVPAALALAERDDRDGAVFLAAVVAGVEMECRLGALLNPNHYTLGFHATGTLGTFGAAAAGAHLLGLHTSRWHHAMGLAGTQAAGIKSGFGTMAKPLHAGRAAANGLTSALLARRGFTANEYILETGQGFAATHGVPDIDAHRLDRFDGQYLITMTLFKYHASCYLTHASIEAASQLRCTAGFAGGEIESVEVRASAACIGVCDIAEPRTGLEGKFSLRATTAMALLGIDTSDPAAFSDDRMSEADVVALRDRISFVPQPAIPGTQASVVVHVAGRELQAGADTGIPASDLDRQWSMLSAKFTALATPVLGRDTTEVLLTLVARLEHMQSMRELTALAGTGVPA